MMITTAFIDIQSLYFAVQEQNPLLRVDYAKLLDYLKEHEDFIVSKVVAYVNEISLTKAPAFVAALRHLGFKIVPISRDKNINMALDIYSMAKQFNPDAIMIITADDAIAPLAYRLEDEGYVCAFMSPVNLHVPNLKIERLPQDCLLETEARQEDQE